MPDTVHRCPKTKSWTTLCPGKTEAFNFLRQVTTCENHKFDCGSFRCHSVRLNPSTWSKLESVDNVDNVDKTPAKVPHSGDESMCAISVTANHLVICGIHVLATNGTLVERCSTSLVSLVSMMLLKRRLCFCGWCRCKASKWVCLAGVKSTFRTNNCSALFSSWISSGSWMPFTSSSMIPCLQAERSERSESKGPGNSQWRFFEPTSALPVRPQSHKV